MRTYYEYCKRKNRSPSESTRQIFLAGVIGGGLGWIAFALFTLMVKPWVGIIVLLCGIWFLISGIVYFKK